MSSGHTAPVGDLCVAVTGATGWLGRAACEVLAREGAGRIEAFASRPRNMTLDAGPTLAVRELGELVQTPHDILLHYAYLTREHLAAWGVDAYVGVNVAITATVCESIRAQRPRGVFHCSSGAAATATADLRADPYGVLKRLDEYTLRAAARDSHARAVTMRVYNVAGPWMTKLDFALSDLIAQVRAGGPIAIRSAHAVHRSYVDVEDLAQIAIALAADDDLESDLRLDTAGDEVVEVGELARRIAAVLGHPDMSIERDFRPSAPADDYVGDGECLRKIAHAHGVPLRGLDDQIRRTADYLVGERTSGDS